MLWLLPTLLASATAADGGTVVPVAAGRGVLEAVLARPLPPNAVLQLAAGVHEIVSPLRLNNSHSGITVQGPPRGMGSAVISAGSELPPASWKPGPDGVWSAMLPSSAQPAPNTAMPRQLWVSPTTAAVGSLAASRRVRARHPNLYDTETGTVLEQFPYMYWASPMEPCHVTSHCLSNCNSVGCNKTLCESCTSNNRHGLRYNVSTDGPFFQSLADAGSPAIDHLEAVVYHGWTTSRHFVSGLHPDADEHSLLFSNPSDRPIGFWSGRSSEGGQRFYVENAEALLDSPGEFFIRDSGQVLYKPLPGEVVGGALAVSGWVPRLQRALVIEGARNLNFKRVTMSFTDWDCGGPNHTLACDMQSTNFQDFAAIELADVESIGFDQVNCTHHGATALWVHSGTDVRYSNGTMSDLGTGAVRVAGTANSAMPMGNVSGVAVTDSTFASGGWVFSSGTAVLVQGGAVKVSVEHCEIREFSYTAISLGWSWSYAPQRSGGHNIRKNHIHHLGFPRREVGDAMACIYTLGQNNGTVVDGNLCHDVRAYMSGGYGLSQDQGSENIVFTNNVCLRTTGSPHNTHYGVNLTYRNNIFWGGYTDSWYPTLPGRVAPGGVRTSPSADTSCNDPDYPGKCPDQITFTQNLIGQWRNSTAGLFEGDFDDSGTNGVLRFDFARNFYWSDLETMDLQTASVFGGNSRVPPYKQLTWANWRALHNGTQDAASVLGSRHPFASDDWASNYNVSLAPDSPALSVGFQPIDTSNVGPRYSN